MVDQARPLEDPEEWDRFVKICPNGSFLQSSSWAELKLRYGWVAKRFVIGGSAVLGGVQVLIRTRRLSPLGPSVGIAYVPRGPLVVGERETRVLLRAVVEEAQRCGSSVLRVEPANCIAADLQTEILAHEGFASSSAFVQIPRTGMVDLERDTRALLMSFKPKMRYNIGLAERRGVVVDMCTDEHSFAEFYELTTTTADREGFAVHAQSYYRDVWRCFGDDAALFIARYKDRPLAAAIVLAFGHTAVYLYGASSNLERNRMAPHAVQWGAMRWAQTRGCRQYDLWGMADPEDPNDPMLGVHRFKLGFQPTIRHYPGAYDRSIHRIRGWAISAGVLGARSMIHRWLRRRPALSI